MDEGQGAPGAVFGVRYRMDDIVTTITEQKKHERLVQLAWQQRKAMLAEPAIKKSRKAVENPTDHVLLFAPVLHLGEPSALLEIVLDKMATPLDQNVRGIYLKALQLVAEKVYRGLARRMEMPAATFKQAQEKITNLNQEVENLQLQILKIMEARLQQFHGWSFESLVDNQAFAKLIHQMLDSHGLRGALPRVRKSRHPALSPCWQREARCLCLRPLPRVRSNLPRWSNHRTTLADRPETRAKAVSLLLAPLLPQHPFIPALDSEFQDDRPACNASSSALPYSAAQLPDWRQLLLVEALVSRGSHQGANFVQELKLKFFEASALRMRA